MKKIILFILFCTSIFAQDKVKKFESSFIVMDTLYFASTNGDSIDVIIYRKTDSYLRMPDTLDVNALMVKGSLADIGDTCNVEKWFLKTVHFSDTTYAQNTITTNLQTHYINNPSGDLELKTDGWLAIGYGDELNGLATYYNTDLKFYVDSLGNVIAVGYGSFDSLFTGNLVTTNLWANYITSNAANLELRTNGWLAIGYNNTLNGVATYYNTDLKFYIDSLGNVVADGYGSFDSLFTGNMVTTNLWTHYIESPVEDLELRANGWISLGYGKTMNGLATYYNTDLKFYVDSLGNVVADGSGRFDSLFAGNVVTTNLRADYITSSTPHLELRSNFVDIGYGKSNTGLTLYNQADLKFYVDSLGNVIADGFGSFDSLYAGNIKGENIWAHYINNPSGDLYFKTSGKIINGYSSTGEKNTGWAYYIETRAKVGIDTSGNVTSTGYGDFSSLKISGAALGISHIAALQDSLDDKLNRSEYTPYTMNDSLAGDFWFLGDGIHFADSIYASNVKATNIWTNYVNNPDGYLELRANDGITFGYNQNIPALFYDGTSAAVTIDAGNITALGYGDFDSLYAPNIKTTNLWTNYINNPSGNLELKASGYIVAGYNDGNDGFSYYDGTTDLRFLITTAGNVENDGYIYPLGGYKSASGNNGGSATTGGATFENGLYISGSIAGGSSSNGWTLGASKIYQTTAGTPVHIRTNAGDTTGTKLFNVAGSFDATTIYQNGTALGTGAFATISNYAPLAGNNSFTGENYFGNNTYFESGTTYFGWPTVQPGELILYNGTTDYYTSIISAENGSNVQVAFQDASGTVALTSDIDALSDVYQPLNTYLTDLSDGTLTYSEVGGATADRVVITDESGNLTTSSVTPTTLGYLDIGSSLTTLLAGKSATGHTHNSTDISANDPNAVVVTNSSSELTTDENITTDELFYLNGVTSNIQTQLNGKSSTSHNHDGVYEPVFTTLGISKGGTNNTSYSTGAFLQYDGSKITSSPYYYSSFALASHNHNGVYEPAISKSTGYLSWTGSAWHFSTAPLDYEDLYAWVYAIDQFVGCNCEP